MQGSRLFKIVYHLLDQGQATAQELAEKFEVSVRTIYRDVDALSGAGIPIYAEPGRNGGIHLMNHFVLDKAVLSEEEKREILTALQSLNAMRNMNSNDTLLKLSALFHLDSENWLEIDFSRWGNKEYDNEKFELLKSAAIHHKNVKIRYASSYEVVSERTVQPLKLAYKAKAWYLKAFCTEKKNYRIFKLNRILDLEVLNKNFSNHSFPEQIDTPKPIYNQITLQFSKEMAYRVYDEFDATQVERQENGDLIVSAQMPEDGWLIGFLLSFGTQVDIIEPVYLKELLAEQAKLIYEKMNILISGLTEKELSTLFDFSGDEKKKEAHWKRDKNLRDILIHLYEWHQLLLKWLQSNQNGDNKPFIPQPYNWKTYGDMNVEFWEKHRDTSLEEATEMLEKSHNEVLNLAESFSNEELFSKGIYKWVGGSTLGSYFVSVTASHYDWAMKKLRAHKKNCKNL